MSRELAGRTALRLREWREATRVCPDCKGDGRNHNDPPRMAGSENCPRCGGMRRIPA